MKSLALTSIIAAFAMIGAAPKAEARPYRGCPPTRIVVTGYTSWGAPIRAERYFIRYDYYGRPVWGYRRLPVARPCPPPRYVDRCDYRPRYRRGYDRGYDRGNIEVRFSGRL